MRVFVRLKTQVFLRESYATAAMVWEPPPKTTSVISGKARTRRERQDGRGPGYRERKES